MWGGTLLPSLGVSDQLPQNRIPRTALPTVASSRDSGQSPVAPLVGFPSWTGKKVGGGGTGEEENRWRQSPGVLRATSAVIRDDPRLPGDPETPKLGRWVGVDGRGRSQCQGPAPFSAGAGGGEVGLPGDREHCSHFSREASRVALPAARGGAGKVGRMESPGGSSPVGCILGVQPLAIWPGQGQVLELCEPPGSHPCTRS